MKLKTAFTTVAILHHPDSPKPFNDSLLILNFHAQYPDKQAPTPENALEENPLLE